jgi:alanine dehydrogenase
MRVGATTALGVKYLSRREANIYGLIGTCWQAGGQIGAVSRVRSLKKIKVFSPNPDHRKGFAQEWGKKLEMDVVAVESAQEAVTGSDIVGCATNSLLPVVQGDWLSEGVHVTCIRPIELDDATIERADICFVHTLYNGFAISPQSEIEWIDHKERLSEGIEKQLGGIKINRKMLELKDVIGGLVEGRTHDSQVSCFINNAGIALQFAAVGALIYRKAKEEGVGSELPDFWFSQNVKD